MLTKESLQYLSHLKQANKQLTANSNKTSSTCSSYTQ